MAAQSYPRFDLTGLPGVRALLRSRWLQFSLRALTLAGFILVILTGLFGSPVGSHNFAILFVWIGWWTALKLFFLPLGGRSWCSICPIPMPGEWLQQGWLVSPGGKGLGLNRRWPRALRGVWLQAGGFAAIGLFSALTLTTPAVTAWVFLGLIAVATVIALIFERRAFCRYLCPMGGFIGLYATLAPLELRPGRREICAAHAEKTCFSGCERGAGCPWLNYPAALQANANCGLCFECLRTCPQGTMVLNLRSVDAELKQPGRFGLDEAYLSVVLIGSVLAFTAVFQGAWGWLKTAAYQVGSGDWWLFALGFSLLILVLLPGALAALAAWTRRLSGASWSLRQMFARLSRALLPLGFLGWVAFTISFAFAKLAYLWPVLSDPFGWGWDLFGTAGVEWQPYLLQAAPVIESGLLAAGFLWSALAAARTLRQGKAAPVGVRVALPVWGYSLALTLAMLWLLIG